ncbi:hypothetical protein FXO38_17662 [Capsicum annuum]|nr:hypothetical protein FXO38_17662 [Capsicum annuum]
MDAKFSNLLVDTYSNGENVTYARRIFQLDVDRDTILYNTMIAGYALHGYENKAIQLFSQTTEQGFQPDEVTFLALLSVCWHHGLVKLGEVYFFSMTQDYKISPGFDHYASMIDFYGRANQLDKAVSLMEMLPMEPDAIILGAFLNAFKMNRNAELAKAAEDKLLQIEGGNGSIRTEYENGGKEPAFLAVYEETHRKKKDGTRGDWVETRAKDAYLSPSLFPNSSSTLQTMKEMQAMKKQIMELTQQCVANDAKLAKFEELVKKHMPQVFHDEEESGSDDN